MIQFQHGRRLHSVWVIWYFYLEQIDDPLRGVQNQDQKTLSQDIQVGVYYITWNVQLLDSNGKANWILSWNTYTYRKSETIRRKLAKAYWLESQSGYRWAGSLGGRGRPLVGLWVLPSSTLTVSTRKTMLRMFWFFWRDSFLVDPHHRPCNSRRKITQQYYIFNIAVSLKRIFPDNVRDKSSLALRSCRSCAEALCQTTCVFFKKAGK